MDLYWDDVELRVVTSWLHLNSSTNIIEQDYFFKEHQAKIPARKGDTEVLTQYKKPAKPPLLAFIWKSSVWERIEQSADERREPSPEPSEVRIMELYPEHCADAM